MQRIIAGWVTDDPGKPWGQKVPDEQLVIHWPALHRKVVITLSLAQDPCFQKGVEILEEIQRRARKTPLNRK